MKTKFTCFGKSAVSIVLSTVMLLSVMLVNAETVGVQSGSEDETVSNNTVTVDITPDDVTQTVMDVEDVLADSEDDSAVAETVKNDEDESKQNTTTTTVQYEEIKTDTTVQSANTKKSEVKKTPEASGAGLGAGDTIYFIDTKQWGSAYFYNFNDKKHYQMAKVSIYDNIYSITVPSNYKDNVGDDGNGGFLIKPTNDNVWNNKTQDFDLEDSTDNVFVQTDTNKATRVSFSTLGFTEDELTTWTKIYYNKSAYDLGNGNIYAHAYYENKEAINNTNITITATGNWPGIQMEETLTDGVYSVSIPSFTNRIIFNNKTTETAPVHKVLANNGQIVIHAGEKDSGDYGNWNPYSGSTETRLQVIAKDGTIRNDYDKYSELADTKIIEINGNKLDNGKIGDITIYDAFKGGKKNQYRAVSAIISRGSTIKIETTIESDSDKQKYYVKAFNINGETVWPNETGVQTTGVYTCTYKIPTDLAASKLEITPIYYYNESYDPNRKFITFIVEGFVDDVVDEWGMNLDGTDGVPILSCYAWYDHQIKENGKVTFDPDTEAATSTKKSVLGGYPGQPMVYEDGHYTMQVPVVDDRGSHVQGVTLNNYVWDYVHSQVLGAGYESTDYDANRESLNCQTYDYDDFSVLSYANPLPEFIAFRFKYETTKNPYFRTATTDARFEGNKPSTDDAKSLNTTHYDDNNGNGWENYKDYYENTIDLFNYVLTDTQAATEPFYIVSDGYQDIYYGHYTTIWYIYDYNKKFVGKIPSSALLYTPTKTENGVVTPLDVYEVMESAIRGTTVDDVPGWFLPWYNGTEYNTALSDEDRDAEKLEYWHTYYDLYHGVEQYDYKTVSAKEHPAIITYETALRAEDTNQGNHPRNPALRNDGRWFYSRTSTIKAEIRIEYKKTFDAEDFDSDTFNTTGEGVTKPYAGSTTNAQAYFTNTNVTIKEGNSYSENQSIKNEYTVSNVKASNDSVNDRFTFEADKSSVGYVTLEEDKDPVETTFVFEGWYSYKDGKYSKLTSSEKIDSAKSKKILESSIDMRGAVTLVAKYVPLSGETLTITHNLYKEAAKYTNSPALLNGTGTPKVSVKVIRDVTDEDTGATTTETITLDNIAEPNDQTVIIDKTILANYIEEGYKLQITLDVESDEDNTYNTTYLKTLDEGITETTEGYTEDTTSGYYYAYDTEGTVTGPVDGINSWSASKTADKLSGKTGTDTVVYTVNVSDLLSTTTTKDDDGNDVTTTSLKTNYLRFYAQLFTTKINILFKYYDREMADKSQATDIAKTETSFITQQTLGTIDNKDIKTNVDRIAAAITTGTMDLNENAKITNVIDEYIFWGSQAQAATASGSEKHLNWYGKEQNEDSEKWVTYYKKNSSGGDEEIKIGSNNDITDDELKTVSSVVVWGFNDPKKYQMTFKTFGTIASDSDKFDDNNILFASASIDENHDYTNLTYYYNQRVGLDEESSDDPKGLINAVSPHLTAHGITDNKEYVKQNNVKVEALNRENENYVFDGWYEEINGKYEKVSSDLIYGNRVTKSATLVAGYRYDPDKNTTKKKGITITKNETEKYVDKKNNDRVRYVTVLNAYGFGDSDDNFKSVSVVYVKLPATLNTEVSDLTIDALLSNNGFKKSLKDALDASEARSEDGNRDLGKNEITVTINNASVVGEAIYYTYDIVVTNTDGKDNTAISTNNQIKFTNKNRAQFVLDLKADTVAAVEDEDKSESPSSSNMVVFNTVKYKDENVTNDKLIAAYKKENETEIDPSDVQLSQYRNTYLTNTYGTTFSVDTENGFVYIASDNYVVYDNNTHTTQQ